MSSRARVHPFGWADRREIPRRDSECLEVNRDNTSEALSFTGSCWASWAGCISPTIPSELIALPVEPTLGGASILRQSIPLPRPSGSREPLL